MTKQEILDRFKDINEAYNDSSSYDSLSRMLDELLKEQEAVEPEWFDGTPFCGNCGHRLEKKNRYMKEIKCPTCKRSVKWE